MAQKRNRSERASTASILQIQKMGQTLFGRNSAIRPPEDPRFSAAILLLPNNQTLSAGLCNCNGSPTVVPFVWHGKEWTRPYIWQGPHFETLIIFISPNSLPNVQSQHAKVTLPSPTQYLIFPKGLRMCFRQMYTSPCQKDDMEESDLATNFD